MIKVKELIKLLRGLDPELNVMLSSDEEGNSIAPLYLVDTSQPGEVVGDDGTDLSDSVVLYPSGILQ